MSIWSALFNKRVDEPKRTASATSVPHWVARVAREPDDPVVRQHAAEVLARLGDVKGAIEQWLAASDLYLSSGCPVRALAVLGQALRADPSHEEVRNRIKKLGRPDGSDVRVPLFSELPPSALLEVVGQMSVHKFVAGEILLREGEMAEALGVVMDGLVRVLGKNGGRKAVKIGMLRPGDFFGLRSILKGLASQATLFAENPGEILVWPRAALESLCGQRPDLRETLEAFQVVASEQGANPALAHRQNPHRA